MATVANVLSRLRTVSARLFACSVSLCQSTYVAECASLYSVIYSAVLCDICCSLRRINRSGCQRDRNKGSVRYEHTSCSLRTQYNKSFLSHDTLQYVGDVNKIHRESKKQDTILLSTVLPNIDRFSKFCHQQI